MGFQLGSILPDTIKIGGVTVDKIMHGGEQIYPNAVADNTPPTFTDTISISLVGLTGYTLTAGFASDTQNGPVQYRFYKNNVAVSGWQTSSQFVYTGASAGDRDVWKFEVRDSAPTPNVSGFSTAIEFGTLCAKPSVSEGLIDSNSIGIIIGGVTGAENYLVQYRVTGSSTWITATGTLQSLSYVITGLATNTNYQVRVNAKNINGFLSEYSDILNTSTNLDQIE